MMNDPQPSPPKPVSTHSLSRKELRTSIWLPIFSALGLVALAAIVGVFMPHAFTAGLAIAICLGLVAFLWYWLRHQPIRRRLTAVLLAIPALLGVSTGVSDGRLGPILLGAGATGLLLFIHRAVSIPISYRFAARRFQSGHYEEALSLVDKAIMARPHFWESYQLQALIFLAQMDFPRAERAAKAAMEANPKADAAANTLGQIYLAQAQFTPARQVYIQAVEQNPDHALHWYHLGLCDYRLGETEAAAESLAAAIKRAPHILEYELLAHYYLWRCLAQLGQNTLASDVHTRMQKFAAGLPLLQERLTHQADTPHLSFLRADLADLAQHLADSPP